MKAITTILTVLALSTFTARAADEKSADPAKPAEKAKMDPEKMFAKKDANNDGKLSKEEFLKGAKDPEKAEKAFKAKDKDGDGFVSKEEYLAAPKKKGT